MDNNQEIPQDNKEPIGNIFDTINYYSLEHLEQFIGNMTYEQALYCLVDAVQAAYRRNTYTMSEIEVVSKSIRKLSSND